MSHIAWSPFIAELRRRLRPETLLTADRRDAPSGVPPRRTVRDLFCEYERRVAEKQAQTAAGRFDIDK